MTATTEGPDVITYHPKHPHIATRYDGRGTKCTCIGCHRTYGYGGTREPEGLEPWMQHHKAHRPGENT